MLDRYVQPPDVGIHADFQERMDTGLRLEKKLLLTAKAQLNPPNTKITAHEWREMIVKEGCTVYYDQITEALVQSAWARAGFSDDPTRTDITLPSGIKVFPNTLMPSYTQEGHGLKIVGIGAECIVQSAASPQHVSIPRPVLKTVHLDSDRKLVFSTEREKNDGIRYEAKRKKVAETAMSEATTEETTEQEEQEEKSLSESSDEEEKPFDRETFLAEAMERLRWHTDVEIMDAHLSAITDELVDRSIAFHFADGWDLGTVKRMVDPSKHRQEYNVDVFYPGKGGNIFHRLHLELYGIGDEHGSPLGSWVRLTPASGLAKSLRSRKDPPSPTYHELMKPAKGGWFDCRCGSRLRGQAQFDAHIGVSNADQ